jgi:hydroxymethylpyrimidine/phosphomethylpyrimidine kinase
MPDPAVPPTVLSFAATDPTGGAGVQADLLTLASLGCHPLSVVTAVTVQDTAGVEAILPIAPEWVTRQASCVLADIEVRAFKIGFVGSAANVEAIAAMLARHAGVPVVLDPVLASGRGDPMATREAMDALRKRLLPLTTLLTPNSVEARALCRQPSQDLADCARELIALGCANVLVTGTHEATERVTNTLYGQRGVVRRDSWDRLPGDYHGSGCTLASACAAFLARGLTIDEAVRDAQAYTWRTLAAAFRPGRAQHVPDRFFAADS